MVKVDEDFIEDSSNLNGFKKLIPKYDEALEMILSSEILDTDDYNNDEM